MRALILFLLSNLIIFPIYAQTDIGKTIVEFQNDNKGVKFETTATDDNGISLSTNDCEVNDEDGCYSIIWNFNADGICVKMTWLIVSGISQTNSKYIKMRSDLNNLTKNSFSQLSNNTYEGYDTNGVRLKAKVDENGYTYTFEIEKYQK